MLGEILDDTQDERTIIKIANTKNFFIRSYSFNP